MPTLTIRFVATRTLVGLGVRFSTLSLYEHCEALSRDGTGWVGAHAWSGTEKRPLDWDKHLIRDDRYAISVTQAQYNKFHLALESQIGVKYNYLLCLGIFLHWRWLALWSKDRKECSQLMLWCLQMAGLQALNVLPEYDPLITPETLHLSPILIGRSIKP